MAVWVKKPRCVSVPRHMARLATDWQPRPPPVIPALNQFLPIWIGKSKMVAWDASHASAQFATENKVPYPAWHVKTTGLR